MERKNNKMWPAIMAIIVILIGTLFFFGYKNNTGQNELNTVKLPTDIWPGNFWITIADQKGFFEENGIKAEIIDVSADYNQSIQDFIDEDILHAHILSQFDLVLKNIEGADLVAVLITDESEGAEGLVAKKEYKDLKDLEGKRVGVEIGSYLDYFLEVAMLNANLNSTQYTRVNIVTEDILNEFENQNLDAAFAWEPNLSKMKNKYDLNIIYDTSDARGLSPGILVFKREFIENQEEDVQAILNTWYKTNEYIKENQEEVYKIISETAFKGNPNKYYSYKEILEISELDPLLDLKDNLTAFSFDSGSESLYGNMQFVNRFIQKNLKLEDQSNINTMLTDYFIRNITP